MYHDTHAHIDLYMQQSGQLPPERELDLESAEAEEGVEIRLDVDYVDNLLSQHEFLIQPTISTGNFILNAQLWRDFSKIYMLMGSHPEIVDVQFDLENYTDQQRDIVLQLQTDMDLFNQVVGLGECGLDYHYSEDKQIWSMQRSLFEKQIELAVKLNLPIVIHCREAFEDLFAILRDYPEIQGRFVVHCFTGGPVELAEILSLKGAVGLGGVTTFNSAKLLQEAVKICPMENFVLETDLPFLAPVPYRGEICKPEYIDLVAEQVANLMGKTKKQIWSASRTNTMNMFDLELDLGPQSSEEI